MKTIALLVFLFISIYSLPSLQYDLIVAQDGSGNYTTINDAINNAPNNSLVSFWVLIKAGDYHEYVTIPKEKINIVLVGEGMNVTNIIGDRSFFDGFNIDKSATLDIEGSVFQARNLTIANVAGFRLGENAKQAVAVRSSSDMSIFYKCEFQGFQDTLWLNKGRHFLRECNIYGTVDFIFGDGAAVFQECMIYARNRSHIIFTAQSKKNPVENTGFIFQKCNFSIAPEGSSSKSNVTAFLGRPWASYSTVAIIESYMDSIVTPEGWMKMGNTTLDLATYVEFNNSGPGSITSRRVNSTGVRVLQNDTEALQYTASTLLDGDSWIPKTDVPYTGGLYI